MLDLAAIEAELAGYEGDAALDSETNVWNRARALDFVAFIREIARVHRDDDVVLRLSERGDALARRLVAVDDGLFRRVRNWISLDRPGPLAVRREFDRYTTYRPGNRGQPHYGFDGLDALLGGVLGVTPRTEEALECLPEMIHYEPSPARVILDLVDQAGVTSDDVFYDLGSGLGQAVILVNLVSGAASRGIEYHASYNAVARSSADRLRLAEVDFITSDVRNARLDDGTVFYLFTPFHGRLLRQVLDQLRVVSETRQITVCTHGPCTRSAVGEAWLEPGDPPPVDNYQLGIFHSC